MSSFKSLKKKATKLAIKAIGMGEVMKAQVTMNQHMDEQKEQIDNMKQAAKSFQSQLSEVTKGKWTEAAKKCINDTINSLS